MALYDGLSDVEILQLEHAFRKLKAAIDIRHQIGELSDGDDVMLTDADALTVATWQQWFHNFHGLEVPGADDPLLLPHSLRGVSEDGQEFRGDGSKVATIVFDGNEIEEEFSAGKLVRQTVWADDDRTMKFEETLYSYDSGRLSESTVTRYDRNAQVRWSKTYEYSETVTGGKILKRKRRKFT